MAQEANARLDDDEISLLDLLVTMSENWLLLVFVPIVVGGATYAFLAFGGAQYRANLEVPFQVDEIAALWRGESGADLAVPQLGLAIDGVEDGLVISAAGGGEATTLSGSADARGGQGRACRCL